MFVIIQALLLLADQRAVPLTTTGVQCAQWAFKEHWRRIGYAAVCFNVLQQQAIVHQYCPGRPLYRIQYSDISRLLFVYERGGWYVDNDVRPTQRCSELTSVTNTSFGLESNCDKRTATAMHMMQKSVSMWAFYGIKGDVRLRKMACTLAQQSAQPKRPNEDWSQYVHHTSGPTAYTLLWHGNIFDVNVFGCGQAHSKAPPCSFSTCWGCHLFAGSWK